VHKNVVLYPWYRVTSDIQAWIPVFFFYFSQFVSLEQVIQLSSIYYISVFFLEVPSGYFSDRIGRRITLLISALCHVTAHLFFLAGGGFEFLAAWCAVRSCLHGRQPRAYRRGDKSYRIR